MIGISGSFCKPRFLWSDYMNLEELMTKLIASLDANTAALGGKAAATTAVPAKAAAGKAPAKGAPVIEFDTIKEMAGKVKAKHGMPFAKKIIEEAGGAKELASVKPEKFAKLASAFEAALVDEPEAEEEDEGEL